MTCPLIMTPPYSMKIFAVKTLADCPKTAKLAKVFTRERFLLYSIYNNGKCGYKCGYEYTEQLIIINTTGEKVGKTLMIGGGLNTANHFHLYSSAQVKHCSIMKEHSVQTISSNMVSKIAQYHSIH